MANRQIFYTISKEKVVNILGQPVEFLPDGSAVIDWSSFKEYSKISLTDYSLASRVVVSGSQAIGSALIGTRAEFIYRPGWSTTFDEAIKKLKEWEL